MGAIGNEVLSTGDWPDTRLLLEFSKGDAMKEEKEEQSFTPGDPIELIHGPLAKLRGKVRDVNNDNRMLLVIVEIFGRDTPVELRFQEVKKLAS